MGLEVLRAEGPKLQAVGLQLCHDVMIDAALLALISLCGDGFT